MVAESQMLYDGQFYFKGEELPDLGSLVATHVKGKIRHYEGLSKDAGRLPVYNDLETGSSCRFVDTGETWKYEKNTRHWGRVGSNWWSGASGGGGSGGGAGETRPVNPEDVATDAEVDSYLDGLDIW